MKIANFREYTSVLRELYTGEAFAETGNYYYALMNSGKQLNQTKADLQSKIRILNQQLQLQAQKIKVCEDKKRAGLEMNKLKQNKQTLVKELKALQSADHFNMLSENAKICVCSGFLFQKYLTGEIIQNNPLHFPINDNGDIIVNPEQLRHSEIYEQAQHIKDFVVAYIARYPEKVKTAGHFKTLLNGIDNWQNLLTFVNNNFDKLNDTTELLPDNIKNSRKDAEVVLTFPQENLLLVKLKSAAALDYESTKMAHCVGKGGYDKDVASGQTEIYSLRSVEQDGEWLPHGTIEFKEGKIIQVKGYQNKKIEMPYVSAIRRSIFHLCKNDNIYELFQQKRCSDLKNCGYLVTADNILVDLYNHPQEDIHLTYFDSEFDSNLLNFLSPKQLIIDNYNILKDISEESIAALKKFKQIKKLDCNFLNLITENETTRNLVLTYLQETSADKISQRLGSTLLYTIGFIKDVNNQWYDLLQLDQEIHIKNYSQSNFWSQYIPAGLISVDKLEITGDLNENTKNFIKKFKSISEISIENPDNIKDIISARQFLCDCLQTQDLSAYIDDNNKEALGFYQKWYPEKPIVSITAETYFQVQKEYPSILIDILKKQKPENIQKISTNSPSFSSITHELISVESAKIEGRPTRKNLEQITKLAGVQFLNIEDADLSEIKELDLRSLKFFTPIYIPQDSDILWYKYAIFLEGYCIPKMLHNHVITISNCSNMPEGKNIKLPQDIKHFMLDLPQKEKYQLPDFRAYPNLESLQINNLDLSDNKVIYLPQGIKYLAFYDCKFGAHPHMDLTGFKNLEELRLNECDLSLIEKISLPQSVKKLAIENTLFNKNCSIPKINKSENIFTWGRIEREI